MPNEEQQLSEIDLRLRELSYAQLREGARNAAMLQGQYGRWLISSLLIIHGAAIGFIAHSDSLSGLLIPWPFGWLVIGLVLALACGFVTWINWSLHMALYEDVWPQMITDSSSWPDFEKSPQTRWIAITFWLSPALGIISVLAMIVTAIAAACKLAGT